MNKVNFCWHKWKYHNDITRQCCKCGKLQYKPQLFIWKNVFNSFFQKGAKVGLQEYTEIVTIKKGTIIMVCAGWFILDDLTRVPKYYAYKFKEDMTIYPSYEYKQKISEGEVTNDMENN